MKHNEPVTSDRPKSCPPLSRLGAGHSSPLADGGGSVLGEK